MVTPPERSASATRLAMRGPAGAGAHQPMRRRAREIHFREVHRVVHVAVLEEVANLIGHHDRAVLLGFLGGGAQVGERHALRMVPRLVDGKVRDVAGQVAGVERRRRPRVSSTMPSRAKFSTMAPFGMRAICAGADQIRGSRRPAARAPSGTPRPASSSSSESTRRTAEASWAAPSTVRPGSKPTTCMPSALGGMRHIAADGAEPDDAQRAAGDFRADELLLAGLDGLVQLGVGALERCARNPSAWHRWRHPRIRPGDHQFLDRVRVRARRVEHRNAARASWRPPECCSRPRRRGRSRARWPGISRSCRLNDRTMMASGAAASDDTRYRSFGNRASPRGEMAFSVKTSNTSIA